MHNLWTWINLDDNYGRKGSYISDIFRKKVIPLSIGSEAIFYLRVWHGFGSSMRFDRNMGSVQSSVEIWIHRWLPMRPGSTGKNNKYKDSHISHCARKPYVKQFFIRNIYFSFKLVLIREILGIPMVYLKFFRRAVPR